MKEKQHSKKWRIVKVSLLSVLALIVIVLADAHIAFWWNHRHDAYQWGMSYSPKAAADYGEDGHTVLTGALSELNIRHFRLMSYWDQLEPTRGQYDFSELDWEMDEVAKYGGKVSLAIGVRQPRYPECHQPGWAGGLSQQEWRTELNSYLGEVVKRYHKHPALESYQLENEAMNRSFGICKDFDRQRLVDEFNLVKSIDSEHTLIVSVSNQVGIPLGKPLGDEVGFSVYRVVYQQLLHIYTPHIALSWWHRTRAALIERYLHRTVVIHELQTEPWGPDATYKLSIAEQNKSMNPDKIKSVVAFAKRTGIHQADLWGVEWWYWRKTKFNDPSMWDTAKSIYAENKTGR